MKNNEYWKRRFEILEEAASSKGASYYERLEEEYKKASRRIESEISAWYQRFAKNNNISLQEARKLLNSSELAEFKWTVRDFIKYGEENEINGQWRKQLENASAKVHISRLESLNIQLQQQVEILYGNQIDEIDNLARSIYSDGYYRTAFEIQKGLNIGWDIQRINQKQLDRVLINPWTADNQTFKDRCWKQKNELMSTLSTELTQAIIRGDSLDKAIKTISEKFDVAKNKAGRLVMTESAYFASEARKDSFNNLHVEKFEIVATLDSHTSKICQDLDGQVVDMKDYQAGVTAPPFHPWCRTTTVPYFEDNFGERAARNIEGESFYVPADMTYKEWKSKQNAIYGDGAVEKQQKMWYNEANDKKQYENYKARLGDEAPKSFKAFQKIKYDNPEQYKDLVSYYRYRGDNPFSDKQFYEANKAVTVLREDGKIKATGILAAPPRGRVIVESNQHAKDTFIKKKITQDDAQKIIDNAIFALKQRKGMQYAFYTEKGYAVLRNDGLLTSLGWLDDGGRLLYNEVIKYVKIRKD